MMKLDVKILGPGCAKCKMLKRHTLKAVEELAKESPETPVTVQHVMEFGEILRYDILRAYPKNAADASLCVGISGIGMPLVRFFG